MIRSSIADHVLGAVLVAMGLLAFGLLLAGCIALEVKDYGHEVVRDADGKPLVDSNGVVQTVHKGQRWHYNKNMVEQTVDDVEFSRQQGDAITLKLKNYKDTVSPELNKVVETSFKGAAELAAKVGAAIASSGGSVAGEAAYTALRNAISKYVSKGGDVDKAKITCEGGNCTITDGTVTETCTDCMAVK